MYSRASIVSWLNENVQPMRKSRRKTLGAIVFSALLMKGIGVLALGRAMAVLCISVVKGSIAQRQEGSMIRAEHAALDMLERMLPEGRRPILVADRGFANSRWLGPKTGEQ